MTTVIEDRTCEGCWETLDGDYRLHDEHGPLCEECFDLTDEKRGYWRWREAHPYELGDISDWPFL